MPRLLPLAVLVYASLAAVLWIVVRLVRRDLAPPRKPRSWDR